MGADYYKLLGVSRDATEDEIKKAGIVVMNEIGLDPGVDHLYAIKTIDEVHEKGGKVRVRRFPCVSVPLIRPADQGVPLVLRRSARTRVLW